MKAIEPGSFIRTISKYSRTLLRVEMRAVRFYAESALRRNDETSRLLRSQD